jgi:uncharacterized membrane protein
MGDILKDIDNHHFEPIESLEAWLATHKRPYSTFGGTSLSGLFNTHNTYSVLFLIAVFIEVIGAVFLATDFLGAGAELGLVGGIIGASALILDLTFAYLASPLNGYITYLENKQQLYSSEPKTKQFLSDEINKVKNNKMIFSALILGVSAVKIFFFYQGYGAFVMPVFVMTFLFILVGIIHIFCTEYFFAWKKFKSEANKDKKKHLQLGEANIDSVDIYTVNKLTSFEGIPQTCPHDIIASDEKINVRLASGQIEQRYKSILRKKGLVTDADVDILCKKQELTQSRDLAIELLRIQLSAVIPKKYQQMISKLPPCIIPINNN